VQRRFRGGRQEHDVPAVEGAACLRHLAHRRLAIRSHGLPQRPPPSLLLRRRLGGVARRKGVHRRGRQRRIRTTGGVRLSPAGARPQAPSRRRRSEGAPH
jgi:hypothetical protein